MCAENGLQTVISIIRRAVVVNKILNFMECLRGFSNIIGKFREDVIVLN